MKRQFRVNQFFFVFHRVVSDLAESRDNKTTWDYLEDNPSAILLESEEALF